MAIISTNYISSLFLCILPCMKSDSVQTSSLLFFSIACMLLILDGYVPELAGPSSSHNAQKYWRSLHMSEQHPLDSKCFVSHIIGKEPISLITQPWLNWHRFWRYAMATGLYNAIKWSSHIVPNGRHGWNSLPIMSLQAQRRRREQEMCSLHVLPACMHAYSASRLCSSVIDRCGWGNSRLSVFRLKMKQLEQLRYSAPNLFIILRVSPAAISFLHFMQCMLSLIGSLRHPNAANLYSWMQQMIFEVSRELCWWSQYVSQYWAIHFESNSHVLSTQLSQQ